MSGARGTPMGTNVVPMPQQMMSSFPAGCCPPGGDMNALLQCYCDIQAATAFISKVVTDLAANDPAFQKALVDGIAASGSNLPLIGVTNGADAQPGQVGEWVIFQQEVTFTLAIGESHTVTMGVMQPGDWDFWLYANCTDPLNSLNIALNPAPAGVSGVPQAFVISIPGADVITLVTPVCRLLTAVPALMPAVVITNQQAAGPGGGRVSLFLMARRRR